MEQIEQIIEKWDEILNTVKEEHEISEVSFNTWLKPLSVFAVENNKLYILVPDEQIGLSYITKKFLLPIRVSVAEITGTDYEIEFILPEHIEQPLIQKVVDELRGVGSSPSTDESGARTARVMDWILKGK